MFYKYNLNKLIVMFSVLINIVSCGGGGNNDSTTNNNKPGQPQNVSATAGDGTVTVKWQKSNTGNTPTYYKVDKSIDDKKTFNDVDLNVPADKLTLIDPDAKNGSSHIYRVIAGNNIGISAAAFSNAVTPQAVTQRTLKLSSLLTSPTASKKNRFTSLFGKAIAFSPDGSLMAIAEKMGDPARIFEAVVQLFGKTNTGWKNNGLIGTGLRPVIDAFGTSIAFSPDGSMLAIGEFNMARDSSTDMGSIQLFTLSNTGSWSLKQALTAKIFERGKKFGVAFSFSPDGATLAVSEFSLEPTGSTYTGKIYLYTKPNTQWELSQTLSSQDSSVDYYFGISIAFSPDSTTLAVGETRGQLSNAGSVQLFSKSGTNWKYTQSLASVTPVTSSQFGISIAFSADNNTIAVGETKTVAEQSAGSVQLFTKIGNTWNRGQILSAGQSTIEPAFGMSLVFSPVSNSLVVGAVPNKDKLNYGGKVYLFNYLDSSWVQSQILTSQTSLPDDQFGASVVFNSDGSSLAVGETRGNIDGNTGNAGVVNIFDKTQFP
ncbi:MAG: hypothetical protein ACC657_07655 [Thiohalomonadales bacterium]